MPPLLETVDPKVVEQLGVVIGSAILVLLTAIAAWIRGSRVTPIEAGSKPPPVDPAEYALAELRAMNARMTDNHAHVLDRMGRFDVALNDIEARTNEIRTDTQVIRALLERRR